MKTTNKLADLDVEKSYQSSFTRWNESSWIRSKPLSEGKFFGLPFSPDLVPLAAHHAIFEDSNC